MPFLLDHNHWSSLRESSLPKSILDFFSSDDRAHLTGKVIHNSGVATSKEIQRNAIHLLEPREGNVQILPVTSGGNAALLACLVS
jgi:hypothetical protein